jgi:hypothetical protein
MLANILQLDISTVTAAALLGGTTATAFLIRRANSAPEWKETAEALDKRATVQEKTIAELEARLQREKDRNTEKEIRVSLLEGQVADLKTRDQDAVLKKLDTVADKLDAHEVGAERRGKSAKAEQQALSAKVDTLVTVLKGQVEVNDGSH